jgi:hypothetical protein
MTFIGFAGFRSLPRAPDDDVLAERHGVPE